METCRPLAVIRAASRWGGDTMILSVWLESLTFSSKVRVKWRVLTPVASLQVRLVGGEVAPCQRGHLRVYLGSHSPIAGGILSGAERKVHRSIWVHPIVADYICETSGTLSVNPNSGG